MYYFDNLLPVDRCSIFLEVLFSLLETVKSIHIFSIFFSHFFSILLFVILFSWGFLHDSLLKEGIHDECGCVCVYKIHSA